MRRFLLIFTILIFVGLGFASETKAANCDTDSNSCSGADCSDCHSVTLSWQAFTQIDLNAIHPGYTLQSVSYTVIGTMGSKTISGTSASFSGLAENTSYTWSVVVNYTYWYGYYYSNLPWYYLLGGGSGLATTGTYSFTTPACNRPPVANAGPDKEVFESQSVVLEGSGKEAPETLRPNAAGDETALTYLTGAAYHWDAVNEEVADNGATVVYIMGAGRDLYNLPAHSVGSGNINSITIYFRIKPSRNTTGSGKPSQKSGTTVTDGTEQTNADWSTWVTYSQTYTTNPATGIAYTWADIDALQIGIYLTNNMSGYTYCTQVYVEVDYTYHQ